MTMNLEIGSMLAGGRYRVERVLGSGGFGITYLCEHTGLGSKVAVKEFFMREFCERTPRSTSIILGSSGSYQMVERFRQKFVKEARALAKLNHKHIVRVVDIFEENNTAYYAMDFVSGGSLRSKVRCGALSEAEAVRYIRQIASALDYVHSHHMMHLDVKPANVLLNSNDESVLIDFGLAKQYDESGIQTSTTPVGLSHGYAPLEQYRRGGVGVFSPATDIYSLGATLYELLTGHTPPEASDINDDGLPALPHNISLRLRSAIEAAMQPRRKDRPQSIGEFLSLLNVNDTTMIVQNNNEGLFSDDSVTTVEFDSEQNKESFFADSTMVVCESAAERNNLHSVQDNNGGQHLFSTEQYYVNPKNSNSVSKRLSKKTLIAIISAALLCLFALLFVIKSCNNHQTGDAEFYAVIDGHEYVDLGLPSGLKWATCNVGASSPEDYGVYYAWGETEGKRRYDWSTYTWCSGSETMTKYCTNSSFGKIDNNKVLLPKDDVAHVKWGGNWRMPTYDEQRELLDNCTWTWTTLNGIAGCRITGPNGNSIFLPAAGFRNDTGIESKGELGYYWSSSLGTSGGSGAYGLGFDASSHDIYGSNRYGGRAVRPVSK